MTSSGSARVDVERRHPAVTRRLKAAALAAIVAAFLLALGSSTIKLLMNPGSCWTCANAAKVTLARAFAAGPGEAPDKQAPSVGTNLDGLNYWSTAIPLLDLVKSSGAWIPQGPGQWDTGEKLDLDEHGWIRSLPVSGPAKIGRAHV